MKGEARKQYQEISIDDIGLCVRLGGFYEWQVVRIIFVVKLNMD
jgi:hypothetical protein